KDAPAAYRPHALHAQERAFPESNCYVDLWIELLHERGLDPMPALAFTLSSDFEGDQWTFFKPRLADLEALYGVEVEELNVYRPLDVHIAEQLGHGRSVLVEADSFHLPDTAGTNYRLEHGKTTIGPLAIDVEARSLRYLHNLGCYELGAEDFDGALRLLPGEAAVLPPYVEIAKWDRSVARSCAELVEIARAQVRVHLARGPVDDPVGRLAARFVDDLAHLTKGDLAAFHRYAFATLRQLGACFEIAAAFARWLGASSEPFADDAARAAASFDELSGAAKALLFKTARAVNGKRAFDPRPLFESMSAARHAGRAAMYAAVA
ncbi:MAG TPA: DUF1839 family protein, partial [Byssovorax sp.]